MESAARPGDCAMRKKNEKLNSRIQATNTSCLKENAKKRRNDSGIVVVVLCVQI